MQSQLLRAWNIGTYHFTRVQVLSPKYDTNTYMTTLFGGEARNLCCELNRAKSWTQLATKASGLFA